MSPLKITTRDATTGPVLEIIGELDYANAAELRDLLTTLTLQPGQRLVLDLADMEFCDSSGLTALIAARNLARRPGRHRTRRRPCPYPARSERRRPRPDLPHSSSQLCRHPALTARAERTQREWESGWGTPRCRARAAFTGQYPVAEGRPRAGGRCSGAGRGRCGSGQAAASAGRPCRAETAL